MSPLPSLTGREVIAALQKVGFSVARVRGSHHILVHIDGRRTVVPVHSGETIGRGLLPQRMFEKSYFLQQKWGSPLIPLKKGDSYPPF
ncbi:type II toxin-antitoxin system HicA family toxin [Leptolyngbya sp. CCNP1308]|uniref:type II toxin-antitoxin system HicA family toxin n=1 Tax=Leptolyngbya sp. CCNP1308 TaxID=3110255 RepID=UPI003A5994A7